MDLKIPEDDRDCCNRAAGSAGGNFSKILYSRPSSLGKGPGQLTGVTAEVGLKKGSLSYEAF